MNTEINQEEVVNQALELLDEGLEPLEIAEKLNVQSGWLVRRLEEAQKQRSFKQYHKQRGQSGSAGWGKSKKVENAEENQKGDTIMSREKREAPSKEELLALWNKHECKIEPIRKELGTSWTNVRKWLRQAGIIDIFNTPIKQTPNPEPVTAANQEPVQGAEESAPEIIPDIVAPLGVAVPTQYSPGDNDFTPEDDKPIPYRPVEEPSATVRITVWTEENKVRARGLRGKGLSMRQIGEKMGLTGDQVRHFFERDRKIQPQDNKINLDKLKVRWIRDVMMEEMAPEQQLQIVGVIQAMQLPEVG